MIYNIVWRMCVAVLFLTGVFLLKSTENAASNTGTTRELRHKRSLGNPSRLYTENESNDIESLKTTMSHQHDILYQQLQNLTMTLSSLTTQVCTGNNSHSNGNGNNADEPIVPPVVTPEHYIPGTHYTRWGHDQCPQTADKLYDGFTARAYHTHGGGSNFLCLPKDPEFPSDALAGFQSQSYIYGVEYEKQNSPLVPQEKHDNDVPCAVCHVTGRGEQMMVPAKTTCPSGWTQEYDGYIMAQHHTQKSSEFLCVDKEMQYIFGGSGNVNGGLLYIVEAHCGSLPCPPYIQGYELSCTVCTL